jgi:carboxymethylenebutenolidase
MGSNVTLTAADGHALDAYRAEPEGASKGGLVVIMEIFGLTAHMLRLTDSFAAAGYTAIAPAMFDRLEKNINLTYEGEDYAKGRAMKDQVKDEWLRADCQAAADAVADAGKVGLVGYCFGGYVAWIAGTGLDSLACSISLYGGGVAQKSDLQPKCPMQFHFGDKDHAITLAHVQTIRDAHPDIPSYVYDDAAHGFCTDDREGAFNPRACKRATGRILDFLAQNVG